MAYNRVCVIKCHRLCTRPAERDINRVPTHSNIESQAVSIMETVVRPRYAASTSWLHAVSFIF